LTDASACGWEVIQKRLARWALACPQVMAVMDNKSADADAQAKACWSLVNLACSAQDNQAKIAALGGIPRIIAALTAHPHHEELQREACKCLYFLSLLPRNRVRIADAGGIEKLISIIIAYSDRPCVKILEQVCMRVLV